MATRFDPFRDLMQVQDELNRLFGRTYGSRGSESLASGGWAPAIDIYETPDAFVIDAELPGVNAQEVEISVEEGTLTVRGERRPHGGVSEESYHRVERRYGPFGRSISLPQSVNTEGIDATYEGGVLTISVPKAEQAKPRKIEVKARG